MDVLSREEKETLRGVARDAISATLAGAPFAVEMPDTERLVRPASCFVTIRRRGRLRGCIGLLGDRYPLARAVREAATRALSDPRFPPPDPAEGEDLDLEVSVLTPFRPVADPEEIEVGRHGVYLVLGSHAAIFLPQVATEQGWDRERLLTELARKAGLPSDAWRDPACELSVFEADVF